MCINILQKTKNNKLLQNLNRDGVEQWQRKKNVKCNNIKSIIFSDGCLALSVIYRLVLCESSRKRIGRRRAKKTEIGFHQNTKIISLFPIRFCRIFAET
jgi:hypothetical protein